MLSREIEPSRKRTHYARDAITLLRFQGLLHHNLGWIVEAPLTVQAIAPRQYQSPSNPSMLSILSPPLSLPYDEVRYSAIPKSCTLDADLNVLEDEEAVATGRRGVNTSGGQTALISLTHWDCCSAKCRVREIHYIFNGLYIVYKNDVPATTQLKHLSEVRGWMVPTTRRRGRRVACRCSMPRDRKGRILSALYGRSPCQL